MALDYVDFKGMPKSWDHIMVLVEDRGLNGGPPDGLFGAEDVVADTGDRSGLKTSLLGEQGRIRVAVLRPPSRKRRR